MSMQLVERPNRPGYAQAAWDVFNTMDNKWLTRDEVYDLMEPAMRGKKAGRAKLQSSLANGTERGMFVYIGESRGNVTNKKYRLATLDHRKTMMAKYRKTIQRYPSVNIKSESPRTQRKGHGLNGQQERSDLVRTIDSEIEKVEARLTILNRMRNDALTL